MSSIQTKLRVPDSTIKTIEDLVIRFSRNLEQYQNPSYKEEQCRAEFINPFFEALGWDIYNKQGAAEPYKEVIHEETVSISGMTKAPDYSFRIGGIRKFFLEAKKPAVNLRTAPDPAYQLRRYAWSAKLPLSILTNFKEFAVYDCRFRPSEKDKPNKARIEYIRFENYLDKLDWIYNIFSKDAIIKGNFDRFVESSKGKRGTSEVDSEFLKEIERWREILARNIALRNPQINIYQLNDAVQRTLDRIVFLRIAEDRGIEYYQQLLGLINGKNIYKRLCQIFYQAEDKYNSGLFDFTKDKFTPELKIDDNVLKEIIENLYYPKSPYEFSMIPPEILGNIYEQFLGKVIRLTPSHRVRVEEKPEVKKAGGVYYTPNYIVDYIVEHTVGKRVEGKKPSQISSLKILDPACGSGSFLLGAYQYLLKYHLEWYCKNNPEKYIKRGIIYQGARGQYLLTTKEKKRILLNNIFGVDIDPQAVEVTKLSLLLKVLENETEETINKHKINAFDWEIEFPQIFKNGGFDIVIGNPPWVQSKFMERHQKRYYELNYKTMIKQYDIFNGFVEKGLQLLKADCFLGYILPNRFLTNLDYELFRKYILQTCSISEIVDLGEHIFEGVEMPCLIMIVKKERQEMKRKNNIIITKISVKDLQKGQYKELKIPQKRFYNEKFNIFTIYQSEGINKILYKIESKSEKLSYFVKNARGVEIGKKSPLLNWQKLDKSYVPFLAGEDIGRYVIYRHRYLKLGVQGIDYKDTSLYEGEKILIRKTGTGINATYDNLGYYVIQVIYILKKKRKGKPDLKYILGILNSSLIKHYYFLKFGEKDKKTFPHLRQGAILELPIYVLDHSKKSDSKMHDKIVFLVNKILNLHKKLVSAKIQDEKIRLEREIRAVDKEIDRLVYQLYGLTEEEIRIVEESVK